MSNGSFVSSRRHLGQSFVWVSLSQRYYCFGTNLEEILQTQVFLRSSHACSQEHSVIWKRKIGDLSPSYLRIAEEEFLHHNYLRKRRREKEVEDTNWWRIRFREFYTFQFGFHWSPIREYPLIQERINCEVKIVCTIIHKITHFRLHLEITEVIFSSSLFSVGKTSLGVRICHKTYHPDYGLIILTIDFRSNNLGLFPKDGVC